MLSCLFVSDLHGRPGRYERLLEAIETRRPRGLFLGGDLLPHPAHAASAGPGGFLETFLLPRLEGLRDRLGDRYPSVFVILGNDDPRAEEEVVLEGESRGLWVYAHQRRLQLGGHAVYGYAFVPPTPFLLKDWERYDVSAYVDPGCVSPEEGRRTAPLPEGEGPRSTIQDDLARLAGEAPLEGALFLFHTPPYETPLDRAALDERRVDHAPVDVHVGSIAVRRFIERRQPLVTLHGHVHESARITGSWRGRIGRTHMLSAAHDGPELALVSFDLDDPDGATRELLAV